MSGPEIITAIASEEIPLGATIAVDIARRRANVIRPPCTDADCLFCFHTGVPVIHASGGKAAAVAPEKRATAANPAERMVLRGTPAWRQGVVDSLRALGNSSASGPAIVGALLRGISEPRGPELTFLRDCDGCEGACEGHDFGAGTTSATPTCPRCGGSGEMGLASIRTGTSYRACDRCGGAGKDPVSSEAILPLGWDIVERDNGTAFCLEGPWCNSEKQARESLPIRRPDYAPGEREALLSVAEAARAYVPYPARTVDERHDPRREPLAFALADFDATQKRSAE